MNIYLAKTQGFCSGVSYAIAIVEKVLEKHGPPLYVYHDIVHNTFVVEDFKKKGVCFVERIEDVPQGQRLIFSAHGVSPETIKQAESRGLHWIAATCPLVKKVHIEAARFSEKGIHVILIGHKGHQEVIGTSGYVPQDLLHIIETKADIPSLDLDAEKEIAYITQTTLSIDETKEMIAELKKRFPRLTGPSSSDICYATQNRQDAVKELTMFCDFMIICGSSNSSNSNRLKEIAQAKGVRSIIIDSLHELNFDNLKGVENVGISSGASVPRSIVDDLVQGIQQHVPQSKVITFENPEKKSIFKLPEIK